MERNRSEASVPLADPCPCSDCNKADGCMQFVDSCHAYSAWNRTGLAAGKRMPTPHPLQRPETQKKYGRLTPIRFLHGGARTGNVWLFACECGNTKEADLCKVRNGSIKSCGCLRADAARKSWEKRRAEGRTGRKPSASPQPKGWPIRTDPFVNHHPAPASVIADIKLHGWSGPPTYHYTGDGDV